VTNLHLMFRGSKPVAHKLSFSCYLAELAALECSEVGHLHAGLPAESVGRFGQLCRLLLSELPRLERAMECPPRRVDVVDHASDISCKRLVPFDQITHGQLGFAFGSKGKLYLQCFPLDSEAARSSLGFEVRGFHGVDIAALSHDFAELGIEVAAGVGLLGRSDLA
jgi:hypothetical protein